jgi:UDP-4-amino-4,6-dideoxy-N-acetyl-beta-L-altrosamine N-acetyltransferase
VMPPKYTHAFIDMDGTLIDSIGCLYQTYSDFLAFYGAQGNRDEFDSLNGPTIPQVVEILKKNHNIIESSSALYTHYTQFLAQSYATASPFEDAEKFLSSIQNQGIKMTLVTSGQSNDAGVHIDQNQWGQYFSHCVFGDDVAQSKPSPDIYLKAIGHNEIMPHHGVAAEDSVNGVVAASGAGLDVIGISRGSNAKNLYDAGAILVCSDLSFALQYLSIDYGLRRVGVDDSKQMFEWRNANHIRPTMRSADLISRDNHDKWFDAMMQDTTKAYFIFEYQGAPVGLFNLTNIHDRQAEWGFYIGDQSAPKGAGHVMCHHGAMMAKHDIGLKRITAEVKNDNAKSISLHRNLGFTQAGENEEYTIFERNFDIVISK